VKHQLTSTTRKGLLLAALLLSLLACTLPSLGGEKSSDEAITGQQFAGSAVLSHIPELVAPDQQLNITTSHSYPGNTIQKVRFFVDGNPMTESSPPLPQSYYKVDFVWTPPAAKEYAIQVKAYNPKGEELGEAKFNITASRTVIAVATQIKTEATIAPQPTKKIEAGVVACLNDAQLIKHVTYPPGATINPNTRFTKRWLVKNTGTCNWNSSYYLDLVSGSALGAVRTQLPPVSQGGEVELALAMVSSDEGGAYQSQWRIHDLQGRPFGPALDVELTVPTICKPPVIKYFAASPTSITQGQSSTLSWVVEGAESLSILYASPYQEEQLSSVNTTTGTFPVTPDSTTTYTLEARDGDCVSRRYVTVSVTAQPIPTAPSDLRVVNVLQDGFSLSWQDNSVNEEGFKLYDANTHRLLAIFGANTTYGTVYGLSCGYTHHLKLRAFNQYGESTDSNVVTHATLPCN